MILKYFMWVLETVLLSSRRAIRAFNCVIIYLAISFFIEMDSDMKNIAHTSQGRRVS